MTGFENEIERIKRLEQNNKCKPGTQCFIRQERQLLYEYRSLVDKMLAKLDDNQHYIDTTQGLWCIDKDPKTVSKEWIDKHAFRLPIKE